MQAVNGELWAKLAHITTFKEELEAKFSLKIFFRKTRL